MKNRFYLINLNIFLSLIVVFYSTASFGLVKIYKNESKYKDIGYDNCNMLTNGEVFIASHFVKSGDIVFDVGAHKGDWANSVLKHCSKVKMYCFEPIPYVFESLKKNILNASVLCSNVALSNEVGSKKFVTYSKASNPSLIECSSFFRRPVLETGHSVDPIYIDVKLTTLDFFCEQNNIKHIDFLKIDTEGSELNVFKGALKMLKDSKIDAIQFEYGGTYKDAGITLKEVYFLLKSYGYNIFRIVSDGLICIDEWSDELETYRYSNYLASFSFYEN